MPRAHNFSQKQRKHLALRADGRCEKCHAVLKRGEGEADHVIPVELGGESEIGNGQWICSVCHKAKTALDIRMIRRAQRRETRHIGAKKPSSFPKPKPGTRYEAGPHGLRPVRGERA